MGAFLMQEGRAVAYMSQALSENAQKKSIYEKELMVVVFTVKKGSPYLMGRHFIVHSDQRSLRYLTEQNVIHEGQQKWLASSWDMTLKLSTNRAQRIKLQMHFQGRC